MTWVQRLPHDAACHRPTCPRIRPELQRNQTCFCYRPGADPLPPGLEQSVLFMKHICFAPPSFFLSLREKTRSFFVYTCIPRKYPGKRRELTPPAFTGKPGVVLVMRGRGCLLSTSCNLAGSPFTDRRAFLLQLAPDDQETCISGRGGRPMVPQAMNHRQPLPERGRSRGWGRWVPG